MVNTVLLADGIYVAAGRLATLAGFALAEAENVNAARLTGAVDRLEAAVEEAINRDRHDSWVLIEELQAFFRDGPFGYWPGRRDFEAEGETRFARFRQQMERVKTLVAAVQEAAGEVPGQLEQDAAEWSATATSVESVTMRIDAVRAIPGWGGGASGGYSRRSLVQDGATRELRGMAKSMSNALSQVALFNRALFLFMDREIRSATDAVRGLQKGSAHYARSINGTSMLRALVRSLTEAQEGEPVQSVADELQSMVTECLSAPQLLTPGAWPTGGERAEVPPAETEAVTDPDEDIRVEDGTTPEAGGSEGLDRRGP